MTSNLSKPLVNWRQQAVEEETEQPSDCSVQQAQCVSVQGHEPGLTEEQDQAQQPTLTSSTTQEQGGQEAVKTQERCQEQELQSLQAHVSQELSILKSILLRSTRHHSQ